MAISTTYHYTIDLDKGGLREVLRDPLYTLNSKAHTFSLEIKQGSAAASLSGAKCKAYFIRADGVTVPIDGTVSGNIASVTLLPNCYAVQGRFELSVDLILGDVIHTVLHADGSLYRTRTDAMTTGGGPVQSFDELVSAVEGVDAAMKRRDRVVNHLDNSDFRNPVNQREQTTYSGVEANSYTIDRWFLSGSATITPTEQGVSMKAEGFFQWFQPFPTDFSSKHAGKPFTLALCLADGSIHIANGYIPAPGVYYDGPQVSIGATGYLFGVYQGTTGGIWARVFCGTAQPAITVKWIALYFGTYTAETLPEYQPKEDVVELMQARTQLQPLMRGQKDEEFIATYISGTSYLKVQIPLNPPMRVAPSVYNAGDAMPRAILYDSAGNVRVFPVTEIGVAASTTTSITLRLTVGSALPTDYRMATVDNMDNNRDIFANAEI